MTSIAHGTFPHDPTKLKAARIGTRHLVGEKAKERGRQTHRSGDWVVRKQFAMAIQGAGTTYVQWFCKPIDHPHNYNLSDWTNMPSGHEIGGSAMLRWALCAARVARIFHMCAHMHADERATCHAQAAREESTACIFPRIIGMVEMRHSFTLRAPSDGPHHWPHPKTTRRQGRPTTPSRRAVLSGRQLSRT